MEKINYDDHKNIMKLIVEQGAIPQFIYKYASFSTLYKILKSEKIYFSKPSSFNDPFDCNLTIDTNNSNSEVNSYVNEIAIKKKLSTSDKQKYRIKMLDPKERFILTNNGVKQSKESFGVSCFSKKYDNLLMWAHYANKHNGVVIKFDVLKDTDFFITPIPIDYKPVYPTFNYINEKDSIGKYLLETKSVDWKYENEIRIMKQGSGLYKLDKSAIVEIIFGCRASEKEKIRTMKIANKRKWENIKFIVAKMNLTEFKLDFNNYI